jgi:prevent-host-death family protein
MAMQLNIGEAKTRLSELVAASLRGEDVMLAKAGKPIARIVALEDARASEVAERAAKLKAWMGSFEGVFPGNAGDLFVEAEFGDDELDSFEAKLGR